MIDYRSGWSHDFAMQREVFWQRELAKVRGYLRDAIAFVDPEVARDYPLWKEASNQERAPE